MAGVQRSDSKSVAAKLAASWTSGSTGAAYVAHSQGAERFGAPSRELFSWWIMAPKQCSPRSAARSFAVGTRSATADLTRSQPHSRSIDSLSTAQSPGCPQSCPGDEQVSAMCRFRLSFSTLLTTLVNVWRLERATHDTRDEPILRKVGGSDPHNRFGRSRSRRWDVKRRRRRSTPIL